MADGHYGPVAASLPKDQLGVSSAGTEKGGGGLLPQREPQGRRQSQCVKSNAAIFVLFSFFFLIVASKVLLQLKKTCIYFQKVMT